MKLATRTQLFTQVDERRYRRHILLLVLVFSMLRLIVAVFTGLGNDEVYYFTYAVRPDWNYFDHPPLVGVFIRLFTFNLSWYNEFTVRLPALTGAIINTFLIAGCARKLDGREAGFTAALFYNISIYTSIISGAFIIPDAVQLTFWLLALRAGLHVAGTASRQHTNTNLLWFGLWTGLAMLSKVHGIFLWFGLLGYLFTRKRKILKSPALFAACSLSLLLFSPVLFWNYHNDFISWQFHSQRVGIESGIQMKPFLVNLAGQILYFNPILFALACISLTGIARQWHSFKRDEIRLLLWLGCPIILATVAASLFRPTLPHWSGPGYLSVILLSSICMSRSHLNRRKFLHNLTRYATALILFVFVAGTCLILYFPGTLSKNPDPNLGRGDFTLDMYRWSDLRKGFEVIRKRDIATGRMSADAPLVVHKWFPGAHLYFYLAYPLKIPVRGLGNLHDLHQFYWLNKMPENSADVNEGYYITPSNDFTDPADIYSKDFTSIQKAGTVIQRRGGQVARKWYIYRLKHLTKHGHAAYD